MSDDDVEHLKKFADHTRHRHFDNRLGLSHIELRRDNLPAIDSLLSDRPEHLEGWIHSTDYDPSFGIKMDIP
jgi:hypothetical protein